MNSSEPHKHIYSVSEITQDIKLILENTFGEVWVEGEVSNFRAYPSGHFYFTLKDQTAALQAVIFAGASNKDIKFKFEDGLKVVSFGRIDVYASRGQYQIIIEKIEPKGIGSLQLALEQLKAKLEKEGLFSPAHKKPIPYLPSCIGVVTSISGAAIKDVLKVLDTRFRDVRIIIAPCRVQGEGAKDEIAQAIRDLNIYNQRAPLQEQIEVMIVGRGGGSIEDLWAFNEETVARAIYDSKIPVISAVGHERDWTIADLVADLRAPTPSAAAQTVIPKKEDLKSEVNDLARDLQRAFLGIVENFQQAIDELAHRLSLLSPLLVIVQYQVRAQDLTRQIFVRMNHILELYYSQLQRLTQNLSSLNPLNILSRGYSITSRMPQGDIIRDAKSIRIGDIIKTKIAKGEILSQVEQVN